MKKLIGISILMILVSNPCWAQKAPDGFLGLKWGTTIEEARKVFNDANFTVNNLVGKGLSIKGILVDFPGEGKWKKIGEAEVSRYHLSFTDSEEFYYGCVLFNSTAGPSFDIFLKALTERYGNPTLTIPLVLKINPNATVGINHSWRFEDEVQISLSYDEMNSEGKLSYTYIPIWDMMYGIKHKDVSKTKDRL
ncbi:MAG: hypothetical protein ABSB22_04430 [Thermodesulfobacteriota bacterium]|jgi:hypothetical protein